MLRIQCPWCGPRDEIEFVNGGEARGAMPACDSLTDAEWTDWLFEAANPRGALDERWHHVHGCRRWFHARRDTVNHVIAATWPIGAEAPE